MTGRALTLSFVWEPPRFHVPGQTGGPERQAPFVDAVSRYAGVEIPRLTGFLRDVAPPDGFILFAGSGVAEVALGEFAPERRADVAARLVPMNVDDSRLCENELEPLSLPAAVSSTSIHLWRNGEATYAFGRPTSSRGAWGLYGIRDIGARLDALHGPGPKIYQSHRYSYLASPTHEGLPHLLVDYLTLYREIAASGVDPRTLATVPAAR